jgi:cytosine/adenosine deaminase-related metal-dependent hydrolase
MIESVKRLRMPPPAGAGLTDRRLISPAAAWWQITAGNAQALGLEAGHGELRGGAPADLVILRPRDDAWQTAADAIGALLYGFDERWIEHTIVNGAVA